MKLSRSWDLGVMPELQAQGINCILVAAVARLHTAPSLVEGGWMPKGGCGPGEGGVTAAREVCWDVGNKGGLQGTRL